MVRNCLLIWSTVVFALVVASPEVLAGEDNNYGLDLTGPKKKIFRGHLKLGGSNPQGDTVSFTNYYMELNGEPVLPVMGEFHYSRYPRKYWEEEILKCKAGGMDIVPTYVFWSLHEEEQGVFDWSGDRDLRRFVELCAKNNVWTIVRIGPFCHGEIRNGGLPDWLYGRPFEVRSNDEGYLYYVRRLYNEIGRQLEGLMFRDGGPIIGVQLENEYQHSASPWALTYPDRPVEWTAADMDQTRVLEGVGSPAERSAVFNEYGVSHMKTLKKLAIEAGLVAPIYTATGWGGAAIIEDETIPVTAAYPYPNWADIEPSKMYLFKDLQLKPDYPPAKYKTERYPSFSSEMGGGMMVRYKRRPIVTPLSVEALVVRALGSGANAIGYYMYHGGATPIGKHSFMSDETYGYPKISYDFQAPLGEFGQVKDSYHYLKALHLFANAFGSVLAPMVTVLPERAGQINPTDVETLRYAARVKGNSGFLFMINFQDHVENRDIENVKFQLKLPGESLSVPHGKGFTLKKDASVIFPFNMSVGGALLKYATAQPLTRIDNDGRPHYFFYAHEEITPEFAVDRSTVKSIEVQDGRSYNQGRFSYVMVQPGTGSVIKLTAEDGSQVRITTLTREQALDCFRTNLWGKQRLILSKAIVLGHDDFVRLQQIDSPEITFSVYPDVEDGLVSSAGRIRRSSDGIFAKYHLSAPEKKIRLEVERVGRAKAVVNLPDDAMQGLNDIFLKIDYVGDTGMAFIDGTLATDHLYHGSEWWIGLKRFVPQVLDKGMYFYFHPIYKDAPYLIDLPKELIPDLSRGPVLQIRSIEALPEYQVTVGRKEPAL
ncbi:MAG: beta-galactosidase [Planctomycetota bacterium]|nr:MAG: beta-galactosidase [Planctomycetota bacterium]